MFEKNMGPKTLPCGTPETAAFLSNLALFILKVTFTKK